MSDALLIAATATTIVAIIVGVVTWMLVLPARAARRDDRVLPAMAPPDVLVEQLLGRSVDLAKLCQELSPPELAELSARYAERVEQGRHAEARRCAQVLSQLGEATPEMAALAAEPAAVPPRYRALEESRWIEAVTTGAQDPALTAIMALLGPEIITWHAHPHAQYGLRRSQRVETLSVPPRISELAAGVSMVVGVETPVMFITPERPARLIHINLAVAGRYHAALAVGREALQITDENVQRFMLGRKLCYMRPEHLLCTEVDDPEELVGLHQAVSAVLRPGILAPPPERVAGLESADAQRRLKALFADDELAARMRRALEAVGTDADGHRWEAWLSATEETSFRCGLLMADDLGAALRILEMDDVKPGTDRQTQLCYNALYRYFVSPMFETLRQELAEPGPEDEPVT